MSKKSLMLCLGIALLAASWGPLAASFNQCVASCNNQYLQAARYCDEQKGRSGRQDWHADCIKNAQKFRKDCIAKCR